MELYDDEEQEARALIAAQGLDGATFGFSRQDLPPEEESPDAMFTMRYEVTVRRDGAANTRRYIGGIGLAWVREFEADLKRGQFQ